MIYVNFLICFWLVNLFDSLCMIMQRRGRKKTYIDSAKRDFPMFVSIRIWINTYLIGVSSDSLSVGCDFQCWFRRSSLKTSGRFTIWNTGKDAMIKGDTSLNYSKSQMKCIQLWIGCFPLFFFFFFKSKTIKRTDLLAIYQSKQAYPTWNIQNSMPFYSVNQVEFI